MSELVLEFYEDVLQRVRDEIAANPRYEVGGKLVGWIEGDFDASSRRWRRDLDRVRVVVGGYIDDGPEASRSAVHHFSDNEYQLKIYQRLVQKHPDVEFIGLWHSHHPNGYQELSKGDHDTGHALADSPRYPIDLVLSSLAVDERGLTESSHYLFVRGRREVLRVPRRSTHLLSGASPITSALAEATEAVRAAAQPKASATEADGQACIAYDNQWLQNFPWLKPVLRRGVVVWTGDIPLGEDIVKVAYTYESGYAAPPVAVLSSQESGLIMKAVLPEPASRQYKLQYLLDCLSTALQNWHGGEHKPTQHLEDLPAPTMDASTGLWANQN